MPIRFISAALAYIEKMTVPSVVVIWSIDFDPDAVFDIASLKAVCVPSGAFTAEVAVELVLSAVQGLPAVTDTGVKSCEYNARLCGAYVSLPAASYCIALDARENDRPVGRLMALKASEVSALRVVVPVDRLGM